MTGEELDRLAALIAAELDRLADRVPRTSRRAPWLSIPVRPEPPAHAGDPAPWTGAAQSLGDIAPVRSPVPSDHRADAAEGAALIRAAAAGRAAARPVREASARPETPPVAGRTRGSATGRQVKIGVSNRHVHLSDADARTLFGPGGLQQKRGLTQPGQFAAVQGVTVIGPKGRFEDIRVVGPARGETQLELARSDAHSLGVSPPTAGSGQLGQSVGGVTLEGTHGRLELRRGVIVAARHLHLAPEDARAWGLKDGDLLSIRCGEGSREVTWHDVRVRSGPSHATEFHLDKDEARAADVESGATATIVSVRTGAARRRTLLTERDIVALARRGGTIPSGSLLTPSARDRARMLGLAIP